MRLSPCVLCLAVTGSILLQSNSVARADSSDPLVLREAFADGYTYRVSCLTDFQGNLPLSKSTSAATKDAKPLKVSGKANIEYEERVLEVVGGRVDKTIRIYRRIDFERTVGSAKQESTIRPEVRRMVVMRQNQLKASFSLEGPLTWEELDLVRTDVFTPALAGLLPERPVRPGDRWQASADAVKELTDMEKITDGKIECWFEEVQEISHRKHAFIKFKGSVSGVNEDGSNRQPLEGILHFDLVSKHISYLSLDGGLAFLERDGSTRGGIKGRFVLTRQAYVKSPELSDNEIRGRQLEPNEDTTRLLYMNPELGFRLTYPRRWHIGMVQGRQVTIEEPGGNVMWLTIDPPGNRATSDKILANERAELQKRKVRILREEKPRPFQEAPRAIERFGLAIEDEGHEFLISYFVLRQTDGGGIVVARLTNKYQAALERDIFSIVRSVVIERTGR
jgi:hypothetical protein